MSIDFLDDYASRYQPYKAGRWCYEDGCIYRGLELLHIETGEQRWLNHLQRLVEPQVGSDGALKDYALSDYNIDNVLPGLALLYLHAQTGDARYKTSADLLARQLLTQPRTISGVFWHKLRYPWQIWLDGLYMGHPFRIANALANQRFDLVADSLAQIDTALTVLLDQSTGLYKHAYDEALEQPWADSTTGLSPAFWSRAMGWLAMALVDVADLVGRDFDPLKQRTVDFLNTVLGYKQKNGLWLQVMNRPDLSANYQEASASAMFSYALLRAARLGLIEHPVGLIDILTHRFLKATDGGGLQMVEICEVAGLGMYEGRFRDGSAEYYLTEKRVADDAKGVGPLMMATALSSKSGRI